MSSFYKSQQQQTNSENAEFNIYTYNGNSSK